MIDVPSSIEEVLALPSVGMLDRDRLPKTPGLYFAVLNGDRVAYVGKATTSLRRRWESHHRAIDLLASGSPLVYYLTTEPGLDLMEAESAAIRAFVPVLNRTLKPTPPKPVRPTRPVRIGVRTDKPLLSIAEAAEELGRNPATVWRYIKSGALIPIRQEPPYLIHRDSLDAFVAKTRPPGWPKGKPRKKPPAS